MNKQSHALLLAITLLLSVVFFSCQSLNDKNDEWIDLFNKQDLDGWTANENPVSWKVVDGILTGVGERSHLFYTGTTAAANFKNFELRAEVMTTKLANSGIYFHTLFQEDGWPEIGYEAQVNTSHIGGGDYRELKKAGSLYSIRNIYKKLVPDDEWYDYSIKVQDNNIQIRLNDILVVDYFEPTSAARAAGNAGKLLNSGTFALQCHDPESLVKYRSIKVKLLDDEVIANTNPVVEDATYQKMMQFQSNQFSFTDMHIRSDEDFDFTNALKFYYRTGVNLGIVADVSKMLPKDALNTIKTHTATLNGLPVFAGIYIGNQKLSDTAFDNVDYIIGTAGDDSLINVNEYYESVIDDLSDKKMNVWSNAAQVALAVSDGSANVLSPEMVGNMALTAKENGIAIEIDNKKRTPSIDFIKIAKQKGCKFTYANLGTSTKMGQMDYIFEVITSCELDYKDVYIP